MHAHDIDILLGFISSFSFEISRTNQCTDGFNIYLSGKSFFKYIVVTFTECADIYLLYDPILKY